MAQHGLVSALLFFFPCCAGEPPRAKNWRASAGQKRASLPGLKAGDLFPPTLLPLRGRPPPLPARGGSFSSLRGEKLLFFSSPQGEAASPPCGGRRCGAATYSALMRVTAQIREGAPWCAARRRSGAAYCYAHSSVRSLHSGMAELLDLFSGRGQCVAKWLCCFAAANGRRTVCCSHRSVRPLGVGG